MAEFLLLCGQDGVTDTYTPGNLEAIADRILPSNAPRNVDIVRNDGVVSCAINAPDSLATHGASVCLGQMIPPSEDWHEPGASRPDGSYGIARVDATSVELVADVTASRTLYYRLFDDLFVASSSQRAIGHFADEFVLNDTAIAWMVSNGNLGPEQTWDERVDHVLPHGTVRLDRSIWDLTASTNPATFDPTDEPTSIHRDRLVAALDDTFGALDIDTARWEVPLSGGLDSREILRRVRDSDGPRAITWGTDEALENPESDAVRAQELAEEYDVDHRYYSLPVVPDDAKTVIERFVTAGEGRVDNISGYLDGFDVFADLTHRGVEGLIRGDEGFGWKTVGSSQGVRQVIGARMVDDLNIFDSISVPGEHRQELPGRLTRAPRESVATWRDRLYHTYRIPILLAGLTSLKTPYIEVVNPFLTRRTLETVRRFPDDLRTEKQLYTEYVKEQSPEVPVATQSANPDAEQFLARDEVQAFLKTELDTDHAREIVGEELVDYAVEGLSDGNGAGETTEWTFDAVKRRVGRRLPTSMIRTIVTYTPVDRPVSSVSKSRLAFRLYIISTMTERLVNDANQL